MKLFILFTILSFLISICSSSPISEYLAPKLKQHIDHFDPESLKEIRSLNFDQLIEDFDSCETIKDCEKSFLDLIIFINSQNEKIKSQNLSTAIRKPFKWG
jgi:hypothetical protein